MKNIPTKQDGVDTVAAAEVNSGMSNEPKNIVLSTGQILTSSSQTVEDTNPFQTSIAGATYAGASSFYSCSGAVNVYILTPTFSVEEPTAQLKAPFEYREGLKVRFLPNITNIAASTINVATLGAVPIKKNNGNEELEANDLTAGNYTELVYIEAGSYFELTHEKTSQPYSLASINGFRIAQYVGDINHYIQMDEGSARSSDDQVNLTIPVGQAIIKYTNATWADGANVGGMAAGLSLSPNTTYHCIALGKDDGTTNWGFDTSVTGANLLADANVIAAGYKHVRYAASIITDASSNIYPFTCLLYNGQIYIYWKTLIADYLGIDPGTSPVLATLRVPPDIESNVIFQISSTGPPTFLGLCYAPDVSLFGIGANFGSSGIGITELNTSTNILSQIQYQITASGPGTQVSIVTKGFKINR